ncbi:MAG: DUF5050 domain-containing protein [Clostridia bacterium]
MRFKVFSKVCAALLAALLLCSSPCLQPLASAESSANGALVYNPYLISPAIQKAFAPNELLYRRAFDALNAGQTQVDVSDLSPTQLDIDAISAALFDRFEFVMLRALKFDTATGILHFDLKEQGEKAQAQMQAFRDKVNHLLTDVLRGTQTDTERAMALFQYFASTTQYTAEAEDVGPYGVMVNFQGICTGYAYAMAYMLDQIGIENHITCTDDGVHVFNTVLLEGNYYHIDATYESSGSGGNGFYYFGMTDQQAKGTYGSYTSGNPNYGSYPTPECSDNRFSYLRDFSVAQLLPAKRALYYSDTLRNNYLYQMDLRTNTSSLVLEEPIMNLLAIDDSWFFLKMEEPMVLYQMDLDGQNQRKVDTGLSVTRIRRTGDGQLMLYDDINDQEKLYNSSKD